MTSAPPRVYLAGPDVFFPNAKTRSREKRKICAANGLCGISPLDAKVQRTGIKPIEHGFRIYRANVGLIETCAAVIADISPFRGPGADPGTSFEMGYARGRGLPIFAYTTVSDLYEARLAAAFGPLARRRDQRLYDRNGIAVEEFGMVDNLMLHAACIDSGFNHPARPGAGKPSRSFLDAVRYAAAYFARRNKDLAAVLAAPP